MKIITADWHLREDLPRCRKDEGDWIDYQFKVIDNIFEIAKRQNAEIIHTGDLFNRSQVPSKIITLLLQLLHKHKVIMRIMPGNHDLLFRNFENIKESGFGTIWEVAKSDKYLKRISGDVIIDGDAINIFDNNIMYTHQLIFKNEKEKPPWSKAKTAKQLLEENENIDIIICGDNHHKFFNVVNNVDKAQQKVINPGCIIRQTADLENYLPEMYLVDDEFNLINSIPTIDDANLIDNSYLINENEKNDRIMAYIEKMKNGDSEFSFDFIKNLEDYIEKNSIGSGIKKYIEKLKVKLNA